MPKTYPDNAVYDSGAVVLNALGSFWSTIFDERAIAIQQVFSLVQEAAQTYINFLEAVSCTSRNEIQLLHREVWKPVTIYESEFASDLAVAVKFGAGNRFGDGHEYGASEGYAVDTPLAGIGLLVDRVVAPTVILTQGTDYTVGANELRFAANPFNNALLKPTNLYDAAGAVQDRFLVLWAFNSKEDWEYLHNHFGYVLATKIPSTENGKLLVNALWDAFTGGLSKAALKRAMSAITDVPVTGSTSETVEKVLDYPDRTVIVTDRAVYTFSTECAVLVVEGDIVAPYSFMTDALRVFDLTGNAGVTDALAALANPDVPGDTRKAITSLALGKEFLRGTYRAELTFDNVDAELVYEGINDDGKAIVTFQLGGLTEDVAKFWANVEAGSLTYDSLAELLDLRNSPVGQPLPGNLPATVNPLEFILTNVLKNNTTLVRLRTAAFGPRALGLHFSHLLKRVLPPQTTLMLIIEVDAPSDYYDVSAVEDAIESFDAVETSEDGFDMTNVSEAARAFEVEN